MKKAFFIALLLISLLSVSMVNASDGFDYADRSGDPADSSSAYPDNSNTDSGFSMPVKLVQIATADTGVTFSTKSVLVVVGQTLNIKAFSGFSNSYAFVGDDNFNSLFNQSSVLKSNQFSGDAIKAGLAEAKIFKTGAMVDRLGVQVIDPYLVEENANKQTISMPQYTWLMIKLNSNPTTGYDWQLVSAGANINIADSDYMVNVAARASKMTGAPTKKYYLIQAVAAGTAKIILQYARPWDVNSVAGNYELTIEVAAGA